MHMTWVGLAIWMVLIDRFFHLSWVLLPRSLNGCISPKVRADLDKLSEHLPSNLAKFN